MTMREAEQVNGVLVDLHNQYLSAFTRLEGARWEVVREARDVASLAHEDWAAGRLRAAVNGYCAALLILQEA